MHIHSMLTSPGVNENKTTKAHGAVSSLPEGDQGDDERQELGGEIEDAGQDGDLVQTYEAQLP